MSALPHGWRSLHGCGIAINNQGQPEVILAGGARQTGHYEPNVDFYNTVTGQWRTKGKGRNFIDLCNLLYVPAVTV